MQRRYRFLGRGVLLVAASLIAPLLATACGGSDTSVGTGLGNASSCADLGPHYRGLVVDLIAQAGDKDPADFGMPVDLVSDNILAFLHGELTTAEVEAMHVEIGSWEGVWKITYFTKADALEEFRELFADQPALIETVEEDPSILPASFRLGVYWEAIDDVAEQLGMMPGVREVSAASLDIRWLQVSAVKLVIEQMGFGEAVAAIDEKAREFGCLMPDVARFTTLTDIDPQGIFGELIIAVAAEGLPVIDTES